MDFFLYHKRCSVETSEYEKGIPFKLNIKKIQSEYEISSQSVPYTKFQK